MSSYIGGGGGGGTSPVTSVFGRTGAVVAATGDYTPQEVDALPADATVGGDLSGTVPDPKVAGIQGVPVAATAPASGQVLEYGGSEWAPANPDIPVSSVFGRTGAVVAATGDYTPQEVGALADNATVGGDLSGTVPDPKVAGIQGVPVAATAPVSGQVLAYDGTDWAPTTPAATTNAGELQGVPIATTAPATGQLLEYDGTDWTPATPTSAYPLSEPQMGVITTGTVSLPASTMEPVITTAPLAIGTWRVTFFAVIRNAGSTSGYAGIIVQAGTAAATFDLGQAGASAGASLPALTNGDIALCRDTLAVVTTAGTLTLSAQSQVAATVLDIDPATGYYVTGYVATRVA